MPFYNVTDWDDAYAIEPHIPNPEAFFEAWVSEGEAFRKGFNLDRAILDLPHGPAPRHRLDLFLPEGVPHGLVVFIHGGYWSECDKTMWAQFAEGALARGFAVCLPGYTLCPETTVTGIVAEVAAAVDVAAARVSGPIALTGHSAGGHLATRLIAAPAVLSDAVLDRVASVVSISGLHDLRPFSRTRMNSALQLSEAEAMAQSPALLRPARTVPLTCWVGGAERAEFLRQNALLANVWAGLGMPTRAVIAPNRHHFNVIDDLREPESDLLRAVLSPLSV